MKIQNDNTIQQFLRIDNITNKKEQIKTEDNIKSTLVEDKIEIKKEVKFNVQSCGADSKNVEFSYSYDTNQIFAEVIFNNDEKQTVQSSDLDSDIFKFKDPYTLNKFLENIVLDYAKFEPINLYKLLKEPVVDLKHKIERILTDNDQKIIEKQKQEKVQNEENANKEYKEAHDVYQAKKEVWSTGKKVGVTVAGAALGAGIWGCSSIFCISWIYYRSCWSLSRWWCGSFGWRNSLSS